MKRKLPASKKPNTVHDYVGKVVRVPTKTGNKRWYVTLLEIHYSGEFAKVLHEGSHGPQSAWWVKTGDLIHPRKKEPLIPSNKS